MDAAIDIGVGNDSVHFISSLDDDTRGDGHTPRFRHFISTHHGRQPVMTLSRDGPNVNIQSILRQLARLN